MHESRVQKAHRRISDERGNKLVDGLRIDLVGRADLLDSALVENGDPVGK